VEVTPGRVTPDWAKLEAPSLAEFEAIARLAFDALPDEFRARAGEVPIVIADFPEDEVVSSMGAESPFDLMGLFEGIGLPQAGEARTGQMPNRIWLYRRPILDYWAEHEETLGAIITHVLIHEIGHHFGFSDEDMEDIENR
jgi:predicted Zn-dependent protease with MMP-like domain